MAMAEIKKKNQFFLSFAIFFGLVGALGAKLDTTPISNNFDDETVELVHVGVILNVGSLEGYSSLSCMKMAISDFYTTYSQYKTRISLRVLDSKGVPLQALSGAMDFLQDVKAQALIIGSERSIEATLLAELGDRAKMPVISFSTSSPSPSPTQHPYLIKIAQDDISQVKAIANITKAFNWNDVILVYEDIDDFREMIPYLVESLREVNTRVWYMSSLLSSSSDDQIFEELQKLKTMQTSVFVVNVSPALAGNFFLAVKKLGMMSEGYAWISTDKTTNLLFSLNSSVIDSMQGVVSLKSYIPASKELDNFTIRWRKKLYAEDIYDIDAIHLTAFGIWAYDAIWALALGTERVWTTNPSVIGLNSTHDGSVLLKGILDIRFTGLSGEIRFVKGNIIPKPFEVVNLVGNGYKKIGYWSQYSGGLKKEIISSSSSKGSYSFSQGGLEKIIWPGVTTTSPRGLVVRKLRIGVPVKAGFPELVEVQLDNHNNARKFSGFCIDVFIAAIEALPYEVTYELVPFFDAYRESAGSYNNVIDQVYFQKFDAFVGDITITANRSLYVDFTLPYTDIGVAMLVKNHKNLWIFLEPLTADLWATSAAFFILTGLVVWIIERPINAEFQGPASDQIGLIFWFSFSTLVFAHRQNLLSNLSRFVVIVWLFLVLILTSSYTATLTSMLTLQQIKSISTGNDYIGYYDSSIVEGLMSNLNFEDYRLKPYNIPGDYAEALSKGSKHGGVSAIIDEIPYIKAFLATHSSDYSMIKPNPTTNGFGFVFRKGSPLVPEISRAIAKLREEGKIAEIENSSFKRQSAFTDADSNNNANAINLYSFRGIFLISGASMMLALFFFMICRLYENWHTVRNCNFRNLMSRIFML